MRVTNSMLSSRVTFNMQRSIQRFFDMQTQMSSGRRINKPSDDPLGTLRDLDYRAELDKIAQYRKNISAAMNWQQSYDSLLADVKDMMSSTKEIAVAMANGTYDATVREASASEVQSVLERIIQLANNELNGKTIFSGFKTDGKALLPSSNGVVYQGDSGQIEFQIEPGARLAVNLIGSDVFLKQLSILGEKADLNVQVTGATQLGDLHNGAGIDLATGTFNIIDQNLGITATIDLTALTPASTINDVITAINSQLAAVVPNPITDLVATFGSENNNIFFDTTSSGKISTSTSLSVLNKGNGVDMEPGKILLSDGAATNLTIDLSGSNTIGDVIAKFNAQVGAVLANVSMQLNATGTGLEITDTNGVPLGLSVSEISISENTANGLGIIGSIDPTLVGTDLQPTVSFKVEETTGTTAQDLGILGEFLSDFAGEDLDPRLLVTSNLSELNNGYGFEWGEVVVCQGDLSRTLDLSGAGIVTVQDLLDAFNNCGLDITASINADGRGIQIVNDDPTKSFTIEDASTGQLTKELGIFGSSDMIGSVIVLANSMHKDDQEGIGLLLQNLDDAISQLLSVRAAVGARVIRIETTDARLVNLDLSYTRLLSEVEDADIARLITDLATFENCYQASLMATARIIQPSLLDFMK